MPPTETLPAGGKAEAVRPPFSPTTDAERREMLAVLGVSSVDDLLKDLPKDILRPKLDLPSGLTEMELVRRLEALGAKNRLPVCFLGAGAYDRFIPAAVWPLTLRGEFATAYTPYQPEASQGTLQAIYEFQTMVSELMGLPVANASLYDGASALAEAVNAALRHTGRKIVILPQALHPHYNRTVRTYFGSHPEVEIVEVPFLPDGTTDLGAASRLAAEAACLVVQNPNFFGVLEDVEAFSRAAHAGGAMSVAAVDPVSLGVLKSPGEAGADIAVGEGQGLGLPLSYGGPYVGMYATTRELIRTVPGRICGKTVDKEGRRAFVLTLQAREQHIRREKASSNVCTNQALLALAATIHLSLLGPEGLREVCELSAANAHHLAELLAKVPGCRLRFKGEFFQEFVLELPADAAKLRDLLIEKGVLAGLPLGRSYPGMGNCLLVCATETRTGEEMERFAQALKEAL